MHAPVGPHGPPSLHSQKENNQINLVTYSLVLHLVTFYFNMILLTVFLSKKLLKLEGMKRAVRGGVGRVGWVRRGRVGWWQ